MGRIKSAVEIALERTESVKVDKAKIEEYELTQEGKRMASAFLANPSEYDIQAKLKAMPAEKARVARKALVEVLLANVSLPSYKEQIAQLDALEKAFAQLSKDRNVGILFGELKKIFSQYFEDLAQLEGELRKQFAPRLRQKEEEMARRYGQAVRIDPMQDPEFVKVFNQNLGRLKGHYEGAADQAREELARIAG
jgi:hypothetical protein